jgi:hypothetical protein
VLGLSDEVFVDLRLIDLYVRLEETDRAGELIATTRERALRSASPEMAILLDGREADLRVRTGDLDRARELLDAAEVRLSAHLPFGDDHGQALVCGVRGALCVELGDGPGAAEALGRAYAAAVQSSDMPILAAVAVAVAGLAALYGQHRDVAVVLGAASRLRGAHDRTDRRVRELTHGGQAALGEDAFAAAYGAGWELDGKAAVTAVDPAGLLRS